MVSSTLFGGGRYAARREEMMPERRLEDLAASPDCHWIFLD
jgi:hypothetical protein